MVDVVAFKLHLQSGNRKNAATTMELRMTRLLVSSFAVAAAVTLVGCVDVETPPDTVNDQEVITTVKLTFTPDAGGDALTFAVADPENDGSPVVDDVTLENGTTYTMAVAFLNELESPAEDITVEVDEESDQHQVFVYGSGVSGPATGDNADALVTHAYADTDANDLPVGLSNTITATAAGTAELKVMLRHLPVENGTPQKVADLAAVLAAGDTLAGEPDADVTFPLVVE